MVKKFEVTPASNMTSWSMSVLSLFFSI